MQTNRRLTRRLKSKCQNIAATWKRDGGRRMDAGVAAAVGHTLLLVTRIPNAAFASNKPDGRGSSIIRIILRYARQHSTA